MDILKRYNSEKIKLSFFSAIGGAIIAIIIVLLSASMGQ